MIPHKTTDRIFDEYTTDTEIDKNRFWQMVNKILSDTKLKEILEKMYERGAGFKVYKHFYPVIKATTCRNCCYNGNCIFGQIANLHYNFRDKNQKNRCALKPIGLCVPVRDWDSDIFMDAESVSVQIYKLLNNRL